jgi:hypothetical protein
MMLEPLATHLALDRLRRSGVAARRAPCAADGGERRGGLHRAARRLVRRLGRLRSRSGRVPAEAFELEAAHELTTSQLWGVWTVAHLESGLALLAWRLSEVEHRVSAHRAYRAALAREAGAASLLAARTAPPISPAPARS